MCYLLTFGMQFMYSELYLPIIWNFYSHVDILWSFSCMPEWWPSGRSSASQPVGHGFEPRPSHTKDFKNDTHCLLVWRSTCENGVGKLNSLSYQWTSPPAVAFTAFADALPRAIEMEIGAVLCAFRRGKGLFWLKLYAAKFQYSCPVVI